MSQTHVENSHSEIKSQNNDKVVAENIALQKDRAQLLSQIQIKSQEARIQDITSEKDRF